MVDLQELANSNIAYNWNQHPSAVRTLEDALARGANCVAVAHLAIGTDVLPPEMHCYEMVTDQTAFETVCGELQPGDLFWFGRDVSDEELIAFKPEYGEKGWLLNWRDNPVQHVALFTGAYHGGQPCLLHSSQEEGRMVVWPLSRFAEYRRYRKLHRVSRFVGRSIVKEEE